MRAESNMILRPSKAVPKGKVNSRGQANTQWSSNGFQLQLYLNQDDEGDGKYTGYYIVAMPNNTRYEKSNSARRFQVWPYSNI